MTDEELIHHIDCRDEASAETQAERRFWKELNRAERFKQNLAHFERRYQQSKIAEGLSEDSRKGEFQLGRRIFILTVDGDVATFEMTEGEVDTGSLRKYFKLFTVYREFNERHRFAVGSVKMRRAGA